MIGLAVRADPHQQPVDVADVVLGGIAPTARRACPPYRPTGSCRDRDGDPALLVTAEPDVVARRGSTPTGACSRSRKPAACRSPAEAAKLSGRGTRLGPEELTRSSRWCQAASRRSQTCTTLLPCSASQSRTIAQVCGSRSCHARTALAGTTRLGSWSRSIASTNRPRSVLDPRSWTSSSTVVVMVPRVRSRAASSWGVCRRVSAAYLAVSPRPSLAPALF